MSAMAEKEMPNESYDWKDAYDRLKQQTDEAHPESWIADENDSEFVGYFRKLKRAPSKFGMAPVAIFAEAQSGQLRSVWLHHTVLKNALYELRPKVGELVLIRYVGREAKEDGTDYANYRVAVDRPNDQGMSWEEAYRSGVTEEEVAARQNPGRSEAALPDESYGGQMAADDDIPF